MEVKLTSKVVSQIFKLIKENVQEVAAYNASQAGKAVEEASEGILLEEELTVPEPEIPF